MRQTMKIEARRWGKVLLILLLLTAVVLLPSLFAHPVSTVSLADLSPISITGVHRLLVFAPHCDDETLGAAGLLLAVRRVGIEVRVVIATNGDGYLFATMQDFQKLYPRPQDFIHMGELRQQESLAALGLLGVGPEQVSFLSYPDRGTPSLWNDNWSAQDPYRSPYSQDTRSPYTLTYDPTAVYAGEDYLADVTAILTDYRPDLILYPHPDDVHPDHWGLNTFIRLAITRMKHADPAYAPAEYTYLVHRPDFPVLRGLRPQAALVPPPALYQISADWLRLDLTPDDIIIKGRAVQQYRSQLPLLRGLMESFVRANELFAQVMDADLATLSQGNPLDPSTWANAAGQAIPPVQRDPAADFVVRDALPAADLVAVYAAQDRQGNLLVCAQAREDTAPELLYILRLKALTEGGIVPYAARTGEAVPGWQPARRSGAYACTSVSLADLGDPWAIYLGANVEGGGRVMDEAAWQMIYLGRP